MLAPVFPIYSNLKLAPVSRNPLPDSLLGTGFGCTSAQHAVSFGASTNGTSIKPSLSFAFQLVRSGRSSMPRHYKKTSLFGHVVGLPQSSAFGAGAKKIE